MLGVALQGHHFALSCERCEADWAFAFDQIATLNDQTLYRSVHGDRVDTQLDVLASDSLDHVTIRALLLYDWLEGLSSELLLIRFHLDFDSHLVRSNNGYSLRGLRGPNRSRLTVLLGILRVFVSFWGWIFAWTRLSFKPAVDKKKDWWANYADNWQDDVVAQLREKSKNQ